MQFFNQLVAFVAAVLVISTSGLLVTEAHSLDWWIDSEGAVSERKDHGLVWYGTDKVSSGVCWLNEGREGPITVVSHLTPHLVPADYEEIVIAGLSSQEDTAKPSLALRWVLGGRFRDWRLQIVSEDGLLPEDQLTGFEGSSAFVNLMEGMACAPVKSHLYRGILSYDPKTGDISAAVWDLTTGRELYSAALPGLPSRAVMTPYINWKSVARELNTPILSLEKLTAAEGFTYVGLPVAVKDGLRWDLEELEESGGKSKVLEWPSVDSKFAGLSEASSKDIFTVSTVLRSEVEWPKQQVEGEIQLVFIQGEEQHRILREKWAPEKSETLIPGSQLPVGTGVLQFQYVIHDQIVPLSQQEVGIFRNRVYGDVQLDGIIKQGGTVEGTLEVWGEYPLRDQSIVLAASYKVQDDSETVSSKILIDTKVDATDSKVRLPFTLKLPDKRPRSVEMTMVTKDTEVDAVLKQTSFSVVNISTGENGNIAFLNDPSSELNKTVVDSLTPVLTEADYGVTLLSPEEMGNRAILNTENFDLLIVSHIPDWTRDQDNLMRFVREGGNVVFLGEAGRTLGRFDVDLPAFNDYELYDLGAVTEVVPVQDQTIISVDGGTAGEWTGLSAVGYVYPNASVFHPLLSGQDMYGRSKGLAAGLLVHYAGPYKGGHWLLFGITTPQFYSTQLFTQTVVEVLEKIGSGELILQAEKDMKQGVLGRFDFQITEPAPSGFLALSEDKTHFVRPDGKKFFMTGANYAGPFHNGFGFGNNVPVSLIEADFKKAKEAGINVFRIWSVDPDDTKTVEILTEMARKYGIYLLIVLDHPSSFTTSSFYQARVKRHAQTWGKEPMVLGYDLANEPDLQRIGGIRYDGSSTPVLRLAAYETMEDLINRSAVERDVANNAYPGFPQGTTHQDNLNLRAAFHLWQKFVAQYTSGGSDYSTFPDYKGDFEPDSTSESVFEAVNQSFQQWISMIKEVLDTYCPHQFITVGYDQSLVLLPANDQLDFANHHVYQRPTSYENVVKNLTTMDRLRLRFSNKPISLGEFGYSSGLMMPDGEFMDPYTAAVGELMFYLYAFAHDYSGVMVWMLNERPIPNMRHNELWMQAADLRGEERFGMYYYDGTLTGKPKPIAHAVRFFRRYADQFEPGIGTMTITRAKTRMGAGYVYEGPNALFVGDTCYVTDDVDFKSDRAANLMMIWNDTTLEIMSTADSKVGLRLSSFLGDVNLDSVNVVGSAGGIKMSDDFVFINLLEGETITIRKGGF